MSDNVQPPLPVLETMGYQILGTKQVAIAVITVQFYDHLLTLSEEIELMWNGNFTLVTFLFFMNRYYALAVFIIYIPDVCTQEGVANLQSTYKHLSRCEHFALFFPFAGGIALTFVPNIVLALRVYAIYQRKRIVAVTLVVYLLAELGVALWLYCTPGSHPLILPSVVQNNITFHICIDAVADKLGNLRAAAFQLMQAIYDTGVFLSIIFRVIADSRRPRYGQDLQSVIASHSVIYYAALFSANFTWAMMILFAQPGLKYSAGIPTFVMACTMVNRITLSLRRFANPIRDTISAGSTLQANSHPRGKMSSQGYTDTTLLGDTTRGDIETIELSEMRQQQISSMGNHLL
ncbi:hypothetical protein M0805_009132 [Coniferiporia weirii]|nr:hypothetical protein M0805_009132 [Coniferiporia weirii]